MRPWENLPRCPVENCPWPVYPGKARCDAHEPDPPCSPLLSAPERNAL